MAENYDVYKCQYDRALNELERFVNIYITKAARLDNKKDCDHYQNFINLHLEKMKGDIEDLRESQTSDNAKWLSSDANSIKDFNQNTIAGDDDCEMVF